MPCGLLDWGSNGFGFQWIGDLKKAGGGELSALTLSLQSNIEFNKRVVVHDLSAGCC